MLLKYTTEVHISRNYFSIDRSTSVSFAHQGIFTRQPSLNTSYFNITPVEYDEGTLVRFLCDDQGCDIVSGFFVVGIMRSIAVREFIRLPASAEGSLFADFAGVDHGGDLLLIEVDFSVDATAAGTRVLPTTTSTFTHLAVDKVGHYSCSASYWQHFHKVTVT